MDEHFGVGADKVISSAYSLPIPSGIPGAVRLHVLRPDASSIDVSLPDATLCAAAVGGVAFVVVNLGSHSMTLKDSGGSTITTVAVNEALQVILESADTSAGSWLYRKTTGAAESTALANVGEDFDIALQSGVDVNLRELCDQLGYSGTRTARVRARLDVPSGSSIALIGSSSTSTAALTTGVFPAGSVVQLTIGAGAFICGRGGDGGIPFLPVGAGGVDGTDGSPGGPAMLVQCDTALVNYGKIQGGGGGGGGGFAGSSIKCGGGGGGAGYTISSGGQTQDGDAGSGGSGGVQAPGFGGKSSAASSSGDGAVGGGAGQAGGDLLPWSYNGGAAGPAIQVDSSFTLTKVITGSIAGAEVSV